MSTVAIPNEIRAGQPLDPRPVMANFDALALFINDDVLTLDGSKAMTGHLTLSGPGVAGGHAVTKAQLDDALGGDVSGGGYLPLAGGTLTGDLSVNSQIRVKHSGAAAPGYSFTNGTNSGMYNNSKDVYFAADGTEILRLGKAFGLRMNDKQIYNASFVAAATGSQEAPAFRFDGASQNGMYGNPAYVAFAVKAKYKLVVYEDKTLVQDNLEVKGDFEARSGTRSVRVFDSGVTNYAELGFTSKGSTVPAYGYLSGYTIVLRTGVSREAIKDTLVVHQNGNVYAKGGLEVDGWITGKSNLQVKGTLLLSGGNWDGAGMSSTSSAGREYMHIGDTVGGGSRIALYGGGDSTYPGNAYVYSGGNIVARFDKDQVTKLYGDLQVDGQVRAPYGSYTKPTYSFASNPNSGLYGAANFVAVGLNGDYKLVAYETHTLVRNDLQVGGQIKVQNGTKTAPAYSFTSDTKSGMYSVPAGNFDSTKIVGIAANGKEVANFGDKGVSFPTVLDSDWTEQRPNIHMNELGQLQVSNNWQYNLQEALVEKLSATVDELTAKIAALAARVDASESIK